ncbi:hypothetical protein ABEB36_011289 [Hypothenemus hampei]|uniref:Uncharacterized protein n=1 Tax=Hypothenemus hampei TaxID=57062 RepID=A0ABD1EEX3_HYPHA
MDFASSVCGIEGLSVGNAAYLLQPKGLHRIGRLSSRMKSLISKRHADWSKPVQNSSRTALTSMALIAFNLKIKYSGFNFQCPMNS